MGKKQHMHRQFPSGFHTSSFILQHSFVLFPILCLTFLMSGCSFLCDLFVVNDTAQPVDLTITLRGSIHSIIERDFTLPLQYADTILTIDGATREQLTHQLPYTVQDSTTLTLTIPPRSTTLLGSNGNGLDQFDSLRFTSGGISVAVGQGGILTETNLAEHGAIGPYRYVLHLNSLLKP